MIVRIRRTSNYYRIDPHDRIPPVPNARIVDTVRTDYRTCSLATAKKQKWAFEFFENGRNHRERNHRACRDFDDQVWVIDLDWTTLPDLVKREGQIIVSVTDEYLEYPYELEIYDDYRE